MKYKHISICILCLLYSLLITGCTIPFNKFIIESEDVSDVDIPGISTDINVTNVDNIRKMSEITNTIFNKLGEESYYKKYKDSSNYCSVLKKYLTKEYYENISFNKVDNNFKSVIDDIYNNEYTYFKCANIIEVGQQDIDKYYYNVEIISVDDNVTFNTEIIQLITNDKFQIEESQIVEPFSTVNNTTNVLSDDSLISDTHNEFTKSLEALFSEMKNPTLYKTLSNTSNENEINVQLSSLISNISTINNKDEQTLKELFMISKGTFDKYSIISYKLDDYNKMANSNYVIAISNGENIEKFNITFSRISNQITNITLI